MFCLKTMKLKKIQMNKSELISEINRLKKEKNAVIMAHYYQMGDIQDDRRRLRLRWSN